LVVCEKFEARMFKSWTLIIGMLAAGLCTPAASSAQDVIKVTDIAGREVTVKRPLKRIVLGEGRQLIAMALIHPDPVALLAGWPADLQRQDKVTYDLYRRKFPDLERIPIIGRGSEDTFSIERALDAQPDIAILSGGYGPSSRSSEVVQRFEAAGVPVVFIDFVANPIDNTVPSMRLLGRLLGREAAAEAFVSFHQMRTQRIEQRLAQAKPPLPSVLIHAHAGLNECCNSPGRATIGAFIEPAGGRNIALDVLKQPFGQLSLEYVIAKNPEVYVGTGGIHLQGSGGLVMGPGVAPTTAREILGALAQRPGIAGLDAVRHHRVHGIWHLFNNMPLNVLAVEALAKWFHPALFKDVDPDASLREVNEKFLPVPLEGTYWISLDSNSPGGQ
jgi:iron complex transport system substrate-binding protein